MKLKIYNQSGALKLTAATSSSSTWNNELMTENAVSASFTHFAFVPLEVNDYILLEGVKFSIKKEYKPKQKNRQTYSYSVKFYAPIHDAEQVMYLNLTDGQYEPQFSLDGSPREHLQKWVENMNRAYGEERWHIGDVIDAPNETIEYSNTYCWDALGKIAEAFGTEWWEDGFYINLCRCERGERISLGYMQGLTSLTQSENTDDVKFFTRLIPLGSTRNIDRSRYGFSRLQLPDRAKYIDRNTQYGLYEHVESEAFAGIYPHYTGTVASVRTEEKTGDDGKPFTIYYFKDSGMAFDPCENEIGGLVKHVSFQTGDLAGRDFEANYDSKAKEWEIINLYPDENTQIPGGNLIPVIGDTYVPWNFRMPVEYETQAEKDYKAAVDNFLAKYSEDIAKYGGDTDYTYIDRNAVPLILGQSVRLLSDEYFPGTGHRDSRMTKVVRKLDNLSIATIECTNQVGKGWRKQVDDSLNNLQYVVGETLDRAVIDVLKTWDSKEPSNYNVFSALRAIKEITERAISRINPDSAQKIITFLEGLLIGNNGHGITLSASGVVTAILDELKNVFSIVSSDFVSGDLGAGFILKYDPVTGRSYFEVDELLVRKIAYFVELVIKQLRHVGGEIILTPASMTCIKVEELEDAYRCYFQADDGTKSIMQEFVAGDYARCQTFNIKSGTAHNVTNKYYWRLVTAVGDDYIDLSKTDCDAGSGIPEAKDYIVQLGNRTDTARQNAIILSTVGDDAPSIKQYKGINSYILAGKEVTILSSMLNKLVGEFTSQATGKSYDTMIEEVQTSISLVREQTDKEYVLWFFEYAPTLANIPASDWTTDELKTLHEEDMFYNRATGHAWRFEKNADGSFSWNPITDQLTLKALENAAKAQDTADNKRQVFVEQPTDARAYEVGDQWANATYTGEGVTYNNDLLVCITAKAAGVPFSISHWRPANSVTTAGIKNLGDSIEALARCFNADGSLKNTSGLVVKPKGSGIFVQQADGSLALIGVAVTENGQTVIKLGADSIRLEGYTTVNDGLSVDEEGKVTMNDATANNLTLSGNITGNDATLNDITLNNVTANSGIFSGKLNASSLSLKRIDYGGRLTDGAFIDGYGSYIAPELKPGEVARVEWACVFSTRVLVEITITAENDNVIIQDGTVIDQQTSITFSAPGTMGVIIGMGYENQTIWMIFENMVKSAK